ncbi:MAG TPA: hypothetical protein VFO89_15880 [Thermoanaerobaculia bacterium]|nr:hypothetical protein [Thermoanaerobaculia bacterium]
MKRQREQARRERAAEKLARKEQRKNEKGSADDIDMSEIVREGVIQD